MKLTGKIIAVVAVAAVLVALVGCATPLPTGVIYTGVKLPVSSATGSIDYSKSGTSSCNSLLALVAWGDASIKTAAENGKVTKIKSVDYCAQNICGVWGTYTATVYGD
jgi:hypothetical protein